MSKAKARVLVVGDWYVDAHWVVAPHESATASRPGEAHSLATHGPNSTVRVLCGAGQVASLLHATTKWSQRDVYGLGSWADGDSPFIQALMEGKNDGDNPLNLQPMIVPGASDRVFNLSGRNQAESPSSGPAKLEGAGTNRVIRIYKKTSPDEYRLVERVDFELPLPAPKPLAALGLPKGITHVLVKDHGHGVVTEELIKGLALLYPGANWYISTKLWNGIRAGEARSWWRALPRPRVRLVLLQQEAVENARTADTMLPEVGKWFVGDSRAPGRSGHEALAPTRSALDALDRAFDEFSAFGSPLVVALTSRETSLARIPGTPTIGRVYSGPGERQHARFMPRASACFAALCHADMAHKDWIWNDKLTKALGFTAAWVQEEAKRIVKRDWVSNEAYLREDPPCVSLGKLDPAQIEKRVQPKYDVKFNWMHVRKEYRQAFSVWSRSDSGESPCGLIKRGTQLSLDLWRAMGDADGAIAVVREKRRMVRALSREFDDFVHNRQCRQKSFLIVDDPGGGKSTIVRKLAASKRMRVLQVNITELTERRDLVAFFDTIVTSKAQEPGTPVVVFVDEINALLENQTVYSAFLAPLEDGHYNRDGKSFRLEPCVWIFAGTDDLGFRGQGSHSDDARHGYLGMVAKEVERAFEGARARGRGLDPSNKAADFLSRLTLPPFVLNQPFSVSDLPLGSRRELQRLAGVIARQGGRSPQRSAALRAISNALWSDSEAGDEKRIPSPSVLSPRVLGRRVLGRRLVRRGLALERVYVGAHFITDIHPDVERISRRVLQAFAFLPDSFTFRELRHTIEGLTNVQRSEVRWHNLPRGFRSASGQIRFLRGSLSERCGTLAPLEELCPDSLDRQMVVIHPSLRSGDTEWRGKVPD